MSRVHNRDATLRPLHAKPVRRYREQAAGAEEGLSQGDSSNKVLLTPQAEWSVWSTCSWRQRRRAHGSAPAAADRHLQPGRDGSFCPPQRQVCARQTH